MNNSKSHHEKADSLQCTETNKNLILYYLLNTVSLSLITQYNQKAISKLHGLTLNFPQR